MPSQNLLPANLQAANQQNQPRIEPERTLKPQSPGATQTLQALFFYDTYFSAILIASSTVLLFFKLYNLGYPEGQFVLEAFVVALYALLCYGRLQAGKKGNRIETVGDTLLMIFLSIFSIFCGVFFLQYQTYILVIEIILHGTGVIFTGLEVLLGFISMIIFHSLNTAAAKK